MYAINDLPVYSSGYPRTVFYIKPTRDYVHIKTQYSGQFDDGNINILAITNHYIKVEGDNAYFLSPLTLNTKAWPQKSLRNVTFIYPPYHSFDQAKAYQLISRIEKLETEWDMHPIDIRYYFANTKEEIDIARGYDFAVGMGNVEKPSGISDDVDNQVFSGGLGENYFHEVVHVYLNRLFPESPLREGLAVMYGGSMGQELNWHLKRVDAYLKAHPDVELDDLRNFWYEDPFTNPGSSIQGLICRLIYEKEGISGIKRLMSYKSYEEIFGNEWSVPMEKSGEFLRAIINDAASAN